VVQFEKNDSYQGIALAMPPEVVRLLTALAAGVGPASAAAAEAGRLRGECGMPEGMP